MASDAALGHRWATAAHEGGLWSHHTCTLMEPDLHRSNLAFKNFYLIIHILCMSALYVCLHARRGHQAGEGISPFIGGF